MIAILTQSHFEVAPDGTTTFSAQVIYNALSGAPIINGVSVALAAGDSLAALQTKLLAAVDAAAAQVGQAAPTSVFGPSVAKFR